MDILVAVDGSKQSDRALAYALELTDADPETDRVSFTVVHAVDPQVFDEGGVEPVSGLSDAERRLVIESVEDAEARGFDVLEEAAAFAAEGGLEVRTELLYGDPVAVISEFVADEGYDGVFVGHRGLSEAHERVLGSVAKGILQRVDVPVTVVH